jgi:phosphohistidine swiveling domain-containing protein
MRASNWEKLLERKSDFWKNYMMISSTGDIKKVFGCTIAERLTTRNGMMFTHWVNPTAIWQTSLQIESKIRHNPQFASKLRRVFTSVSESALRTAHNLEKQNFSRRTDKEILRVYFKFCDAYRKIYAPFHLALYVSSIEVRLNNWLMQKLQKEKLSHKFNEYFNLLITPPDLSFLQQEELALIKTALKVKRGLVSRSKIPQLLTYHTQAYAGLPVVNDETKPWSQKYFAERLRKITKKSTATIERKYNSLRQYPLHIQHEQAVIFKQFSAPKPIRILFKFLQDCIWVRLASRNVFALSHYYSRELFKQLGKHCGISAEEIKWYAPAEIQGLISRRHTLTAQQLRARKKVAVLLFRNGHHRILAGSDARKFIRRELGTPTVPKATTLQGMPAYPGKVRGLVKLIFRQADIKKMDVGNILVARMTTPDLMPAVRLAKGVVTDEGGITCHAAIVSRELQIPCIVGTKFATKLLRDGDQIELNAKAGTIKKL